MRRDAGTPTPPGSRDGTVDAHRVGMITQVLQQVTPRLFLLSIIDPVVEHALVAEIATAIGGAGVALLLRHWIERANVLAAVAAGLTFVGGVAWLSATQLGYSVFWRQECPECIDRFPESYDAVWLGEVLARSAMDALIGSLAVALVVTLVLRRTRSIA